MITTILLDAGGVILDETEQAKQVGMKTIRMRTGLHMRQEPRLPEEFPDKEVHRLSEIPEKIEKIIKDMNS